MTYYSQPQPETPARRQQGQVCRLQKTISAVLVAAGSSTRMGFDKLSFDLGGETVLHRSIRAFDQCPQIGEIVLVAGKNRAFVEQQAVGCTKPVQIVAGGATRAESAKNGVLAAHGELVAVHDAARPFVSPAVIAAVLLLLNTYPLLVSEDLVFRSKETNMTGSVSVVVYSLAGLNRLNQENVAAAMAVVEETGLSRVLVTDSTGLVLYDTRETGSAVGKYTFYSEIVQALEGYDAFSCSYRDGAFRSRTASPVLYQNRIIGAVYAYEYDTQQAELLQSFQTNLTRISLLIGVLVVALSALLSRAFTRKIRELLQAIRQVREGAYSHRASVRGNDEIAQLATEFNSLTDRLQTTEAARRRFVSDASHELKTPLTSISGYAELIETGIAKPEDTPGFARKIHVEASRMIQLVNDILQLSHLDNVSETGAAPAMETVDLLDVARECVERQKVNARRSYISLTYLGESAPVTGSRVLLDELCQNLCDNAIRYNRPGGKVQIITACTRDGHCTLTVKDNGIGIPKEAQTSVFERFYRVDKSRSKATGGTGLGLAIVKHIARIHNARIKLDSVVDEGTTITVIFETAS